MFNLVRGVTYRFITVIPNLNPVTTPPTPFSVIEGEVIRHIDHLPLVIIHQTGTLATIQINLNNVVAVI